MNSDTYVTHNKKLLRYSIDSWSQIVGCQSNNSPKLHLTYDIVMDRMFTGSIIRVEHDLYGCLFSYVVDGSGLMLSEDSNGTIFQLTDEEILMELAKYGFLIEFDKVPYLDDVQYQLVCSAQLFNMNKIRIMYVRNDNNVRGQYEATKAYLVVFDDSKVSDWLSNTKVCTKSEFSKVLTDGYAINLSECDGGLHSEHNWSFLIDKVLNITELLRATK